LSAPVDRLREVRDLFLQFADSVVIDGRLPLHLCEALHYAPLELGKHLRGEPASGCALTDSICSLHAR